MTRILVPRGSAGSSSSCNQNRPSSSSVPSASSSSSAPASTHLQATNNNNNNQNHVVSTLKDEELAAEAQEQVPRDNCLEHCGALDSKGIKSDDLSKENLSNDENDKKEKIIENELLPKDDFMGSGDLLKVGLSVVEEETESSVVSSLQMVTCSSCPPPPPVPPPRPASLRSNPRRSASGTSNAVRKGSSRRPAGWPAVSTQSSPTGSRPSSSRSHCESEGYNSADEQIPLFGSSYDDAERERQFVLDLKRVKGLEVKKMLADGNCLFRAVADQVYGDSELYDLARQRCIDYMERERDHFSQFITEDFTSYCKRKRRDKVYGNNVEIQALSEIYNCPIHIYSYRTEPINIFHGNYTTDTPPIRLSYHHGKHYNSLVDPLSIGAGLGFSSLRGGNVDKDQVKAAIKAQQDQQINNALLAEGRFYSDLELTEKEIERMAIEVSRAEFLANDKLKQIGHRESSTSGAEPSSSRARSSISDTKEEAGRDSALQDGVLSSSIQIVLSMGFSYLKAMKAYSIFGDDLDSMVSYLLETSNSRRRKGKAKARQPNERNMRV